MKGMNIASRTPQRAVATTPATTPATTQPQWAAAPDPSPQWAAAVVVDDTSLGPVPPIAAAVVECVPPAQEVERPTLPESERRAPERQPSCPLSMYEELGVARPSQPNTPLLTPTMLTPINTSVINHNVAEINLGAAVAAPAVAPDSAVCAPMSPVSSNLYADERQVAGPLRRRLGAAVLRKGAAEARAQAAGVGRGGQRDALNAREGQDDKERRRGRGDGGRGEPERASPEGASE